MPLKFGSTNIPTIYKGNTKIDKIYKGSTLVYQSSLLPFGYTECEYLESTGTQYIDTGYYATNTSGINIDFAYTKSGNAGLCGIFQSTAPRTDTLFITTLSGQTSTVMYLISQGGELTNNVVPVIGTKYNAKINYLNNRKLIINNTTTGDDGSNGVVSTRTIKLFCRDNGGNLAYTNARIYECILTTGNIIARYLVPCLDNNGVPCMYDLVGKQSYYNQGTGEFSFKVDKKALPGGYTALNYLESTGTQWLQTDKKLGTGKKVILDYMFNAFNTGTENYTIIFGTRRNSPFTSFGANRSKYLEVAVNSTWYSPTSGGFLYQTNTKYHAIFDINTNYSVTCNGTTVTTGTTTAYTDADNFTIFRRLYTTGTEGVFLGKIYSFKMYNSNELELNLIPCLDNTGTPCMYDLVSKTTFYNAGSGTFNYG